MAYHPSTTGDPKTIQLFDLPEISVSMKQISFVDLSPPCTVSVERYLDWEAIRLNNGIVDLIAVPEIGGRILQLRLGGQEYLYVNPRHTGRVYTPEENNFAAGWKNYGGSKVWPAPQGWSSGAEWPGPPDPILDGGKYSWEILETDAGGAVLALTSPPDEYTGLTLQRQVHLSTGTATIQIRHRMYNSSSRPVRWALWQVTQQSAGPAFEVFAPAKIYQQILGDDKFEAVQNDHHSGLFRLRYVNRVAKLAIKAEEGWICSLDASRGLLLAERFRVFPGAAYVDNAPLAVWVNGAGSYTVHSERIHTLEDPNGCDAYVETEVFSPLVDLEPGGEYLFDTFWHCAQIEANSVERVNQSVAIGRDLSIERRDNSLHVTASFGVFQAGNLEIVGLSKNGRVVAVKPLGTVTPLLPCQLDICIPVEEDLSRLNLRIRNKSGELLGNISTAVLNTETN